MHWYVDDPNGGTLLYSTMDTISPFAHPTKVNSIKSNRFVKRNVVPNFYTEPMFFLYAFCLHQIYEHSSGDNPRSTTGLR